MLFLIVCLFKVSVCCAHHLIYSFLVHLINSLIILLRSFILREIFWSIFFVFIEMLLMWIDYLKFAVSTCKKRMLVSAKFIWVKSTTAAHWSTLGFIILRLLLYVLQKCVISALFINLFLTWLLVVRREIVLLIDTFFSDHLFEHVRVIPELQTLLAHLLNKRWLLFPIFFVTRWMISLWETILLLLFWFCCHLILLKRNRFLLLFYQT